MKYTVIFCVLFCFFRSSSSANWCICIQRYIAKKKKKKRKTLQKYKLSRCKLHIFYVALNAILKKVYCFWLIRKNVDSWPLWDRRIETLSTTSVERSISVSHIVGGNKVRDHFFSERWNVGALKVHFYFHCPRGFCPPVVVALLTQAVISYSKTRRSVSHLHKYIEDAFKLAFRVLERWASVIPGCYFLKFKNIIALDLFWRTRIILTSLSNSSYILFLIWKIDKLIYTQAISIN